MTSSGSWRIARTVAPAAVLLALALAAASIRAEPPVDGVCAGLDRYTAKSYATEKGLGRRCALLEEVSRGGQLDLPSLREKILDELSNRFAVEMDFDGAVALPGRAVDYLLENMPETAALVSRYTGKEYHATQSGSVPGPTSFFVTNTTSFAADFVYLVSRETPTASEHVFFESGQARVLLWRIWGNSFVHYKLQKNGDENARYDITVHVFTSSRLLRTVLSSGLFRYFANRMFRGILGDIESAVTAFVDDPKPVEHLPPYFVTGLKSRLENEPAAPPPGR
ncbi:MAG: hypothetical protein U5R46_04000 [Gammaproteobacteria bacterium]|nr:hypothetical protein [Gammaproteobacteria bacterium]